MTTLVSYRIVLVMIALATLVACSPAVQVIPAPSITLTPGTQAATLGDRPESDPALVRKTGRPQVIVFFAYWCIDCQRMHPVIAELEAEYKRSIDFLYINIDAENTRALREELTFSGLRPTIVFLDKSGKEVRRTVGVQERETLHVILDGLAAG